jgi:heme-degrading monooxygenase HmoA
VAWQILCQSREAVYAAHSNRQSARNSNHGQLGKQAETLSSMTDRARFMARQPGFISVSLHRSLDGRRIVTYIQWHSRDLLQSAHKLPEFRTE